MSSISHYILFFFLLTNSLMAIAANQEAHTHGLAKLTLALENDILEIQFESPASNIVGFEHKATSTKEKKAVTQAKAMLIKPNGLFSFVGASCQPQATKVDVSGVMEDKHKEHGEHEHHSHSNEHHHEGGHSEISASYRFSCKNTKKLSSVSVALLDQFPGIEKVDAMWITEIKQGAVTLNSDKNVISLR